MRFDVLSVVIVLSVLAGCGGQPEESVSAPVEEPLAPEPAALPDLIVAERGGFIPEGVEYDTANERFLTGSLSEGSILEIHPDGRVTVVVTDSELVSSVGIEVDEPRNRLIAANSDRSVFQTGGAGQAKLGVYDLTTGDRIAMVDLAASVGDASDEDQFFANDAAVGDDGTIYVTDTRMGVVYAVSNAYEASVLHRFDGFSPNGIVYHTDGYLLVAGGTSLWKVPVEDPSSASPVTLPEEIEAQDGAVWTEDGRLAIVSGSGNRVVALSSQDEWATADLAGVAEYEISATTVAVVGGDLYVVHPTFQGDDPPSLEMVTLR